MKIRESGVFRKAAGQILQSAPLSDLRDAYLRVADLENCNLDGAKLHGVDLSTARNIPEKYLP